METKHSPAPWFIDPILGSTVLHGGEGGPFLVARIAMHDREEGLANARIVASAPQMLAMLQELRECAEYWSEYDVPVGIVDRIDAVIATALGVSPNT